MPSVPEMKDEGFRADGEGGFKVALEKARGFRFAVGSFFGQDFADGFIHVKDGKGMAGSIQITSDFLDFIVPAVKHQKFKAVGEHFFADGPD